MSFPDAEEKEVCATTIQYGRRRLHLTEGQIKRLCPKKEIGCGTYACAYTTRDDNTVVKFTADPEDVSAFLAVGKTSKRVARLRNAWLVSPEQKGVFETRPAVYALEVERVYPVDNVTREALNNVMQANELFRTFGAVAKDPDFGKKSFSRAALRKTVPAKCAREVQARPRTAIAVDECVSVLDQTIQIHEDLARRGVAFTDAHGGNVGWRWTGDKGTLVALDLGLSQIPLNPKRVRALRGLSVGFGKRLKVLRARQRSRGST